MEKNREEKFDEIVKKTIKEIGLEKPSPNFTDAVLSKIKLTNESPLLTYRPLISKWIWVTILALFAIVFVRAFQTDGHSGQEIALPDYLKNSVETGISTLLSFELPGTFTYGIIAFAIFAFFQIILIKQRLENQYAMN